jgi:hypothetical protein
MAENLLMDGTLRARFDALLAERLALGDEAREDLVEALAQKVADWLGTRAYADALRERTLPKLHPYLVLASRVHERES